MSGIPATRNRRVRLPTADDECGLTEPVFTEPHAVDLTVRGTGQAVSPPENGR